MKHLLNDLSSEEKNRILEQYDNSFIVETSKFNKLMKSKLGNVKPLMERDGDHELDQHMRQTHSPYGDPMDEFPFPEKNVNMAPIEDEDDESNEDEFEYPSDKQFKYLSAEQFKDRIDDFFSNYGDYINPERLKQEVDMLLGFMNDDFEYIGEGNEERVDDDVSYEKKGSPLVTITVDGGDLIKAYLTNDYKYDYGVNSVELKGRFFFDENVYNNFINKN